MFDLENNYYNVTAGYVIDGNRFTTADEARNFLRKTCDMTVVEATHYLNRLVAAFTSRTKHHRAQA